MSSQTHCQFVNDDSPPFLFILPPLLSLSVPPSPYLYCPTVGLLNISPLELFQCNDSFLPCNIKNLDFRHSTNVIIYNLDTGGFCSGHRNSLSKTSLVMSSHTVLW